MAGARMTATHSLERIGPKGQTGVDWQCRKCGLVTKDLSAVTRPCPAGGSQEQDLLDAIRG